MLRIEAGRKAMLLAVLGAAGCADAPILGSDSRAITWGEPDVANEYASTGALMVTWSDGSHYPACSGTLISDRVFLTAAHCTDAIQSYRDTGDVTEVAVSFDVDPYAPGASLHAIDRLVTHPEYDGYLGASDPHDLGAVVLAEPAAGITPATLPSEGLLGQLRASGALGQGSNAASFQVAGYGGTLDFPPPSISYEDTRRAATSRFKNLHAQRLFLNQNHRATGEGGTCYGDSGGPAFWEDADGRVLVAVTASGDAMCVSTGIYYRIDTAGSLAFIDSVVAST